jgi:hypothetical protein
MHLQNGISVHAAQLHQGGLSIIEESRLRDVLRGQSPSEYWVDVQFVEVRRLDDRMREVVRRIHDPSAFPPGGANTAMIRCPICGIFTPSPGMEEGACLDHCRHSHWGPSPSAVAIRAMQYFHVRVGNACELLPESEEALIAEIHEYENNCGSARREK